MPLTIESVTRTYGEKRVLSAFSHTFPERGLVAITGPSGCGKTTLLRLIAGLEQPDEGVVRLPAGVRLSMVFQEDRLLPTLDARGNILAAVGDSGEAAVRLADDCLARCGLAGEETHYPAQLSGGMRRRVAIARAMAVGGDLLLLDEPFRGLDDRTRRLVMDYVLAERERRLTLLVTHAPDEMAVADARLRL